MAKRIWILEVKKHGLWFSWTKAYHYPGTTLWGMECKPHYAESLRSILAVKDEILDRAGDPDTANRLLQSWEERGKFNIAAAYTWFRTAKPILTWARALSHHSVIPNHGFINSLAIQQKLATVDTLIRKGIYIINRCILWKKDNESHLHHFFQCLYVADIWKGVLR
ncbi:uncharacterized protein LOC141628424 [Silene latifolia]|uniref:uncharacterized protein LOC141628424 n=1 Tax=Silene latifolia TaxID=37657 RepID=UPI003D784F1D